MIRCAKLHTEESLGNIINSTSIDIWQYPAEDSVGDLVHFASYSMYLSDADKGKRWKVMGKIKSNYGKWHWLQEVIEV